MAGNNSNLDYEEGCFSQNNTVLRVEKLQVEEVGIDQIKKGDMVVVGYNQMGMPQLDQVLGHFHYDPSLSSEFIRISLANGLSLEVTPLHLLYVGSLEEENTRFAKDVRLYDTMLVY